MAKTTAKKKSTDVPEYVPRRPRSYEEELNTLKAHGYNAFYEDGLLMIWVTRAELDDKSFREEFKKLIEEMHWERSYGMRVIQGGDVN